MLKTLKIKTCFGKLARKKITGQTLCKSLPDDLKKKNLDKIFKNCWKKLSGNKAGQHVYISALFPLKQKS